jgi:hypothetical protein
VFAPFVDYDGQFRPQLRSLRLLTPWDIGADEIPRAAASIRRAANDPGRETE